MIRIKLQSSGADPEILVRGGVGGVWAMAGVQGKVAFGLSHFCTEVFQKKF